MFNSVHPSGRTLGALAIAFAIAACDGGDGDKALPAAASPPVEDRTAWDGAKIYDEVCDKCHKMGVDGAPELGDTAAWGERIGKGRSTLLQHVREGFNKMPARGDCEFCTDGQLASALDYMMSQSR